MKPFVNFVPCALLALALAGCSPSSGGNNAAVENASAQVSNEATNNSAVVSTDATPTVTERASLLSNVWVPGKDDKLHSKAVSKEALDSQKKFGDPTAALADIIKMSPQYFPPKTSVLDYHDDGKSVSVNLSKDFNDTEFWSKAGETTVRLAVYALVNTASDASGAKKPVVLKTDNSPLSTLGELDVSDAIEPDAKLQAKAGAASAPSAGSQAGGA
ncbi:hypothetical protein EON83_01190 [bacterium]|nr:MAG: hypothetical protein EON83_01190 [bacterium]